MNMLQAVLALLTLAVAAWGGQAQTNPLSKVVQLMDDLTAKVIKEGEAEAKAYKEYFEWCDDASANTAFAIKTATSQKAKLEAKIGELKSNIEVGGTKIDELAGAIAQAEAEVKNATLIRDKENSDFGAGEKELMDAIDTLERSLAVIEREMAKNPAVLAQVDTTNMAKMISALSTVLDAAAFSSTDAKKLLAFVQAQDGAEDDDTAPGAPAAAVYKSQSGGVVDVLQDMKEKAESQLSDLRKAETNAKHNYNLLKQSLEDQAAADTKDMNDEKAAKAEAEEAKADAEGDLEQTKKELANAKLESTNGKSSCMTVAADHEATVAARTEELKVIAEAKKMLTESTSGAVSQTYSFLQTSSNNAVSLQTRADLANSEVVTMIRQLAKKQHSSALAQLASKIAAVAKYGGAGGDDPFGKVKGLIMDMITKLEKEADSEATEKAYCDEQMAKTAAKKDELEDDIAKMSSKIDQAAAKSAQLKEEIKELGDELVALSKEQAEMDKLRQETNADYTIAKADLEQGLSGVRKALTLLREYYGAAAFVQDGTLSGVGAFMQQPAKPEKHDKAAGAGTSIIGILEVIESDFAKNLAKEEAEEADAQSIYEKTTQENKITKTIKDQDVAYKTQESKSLDKTVSEYSSDREAAASELAAVNQYFAQIKARCIAKPETYEERQRRRQAEIAGLKEALTILKEETAFVQRKHRGSFRGSALAADGKL